MRSDQLAGSMHERAGKRTRSEDAEPREQHPLAADAVAEAPGSKDKRREHQAVRVDDPLQIGRRRAELAHERRQRDVHDRHVDVDDQRREAEREEDRALVAAGSGNREFHVPHLPVSGPGAEANSSNLRKSSYYLKCSNTALY